MALTSARRFVPLDVFRGLTIFLMIIVNTPGAGAEPFPSLLHAEWHGCTLTDLVFPSFLFAVGASMPFVLKKWETLSAPVVWFKILKRSTLIFVLGILLTWYTSMYWSNGGISFPSISGLRIMAVLQRIALCYLLAAIIVRWSSDRTVVIVSLLLLVAYWIILYLFGDPGQQYTITGNAVRKLDLLVIGEKHMYRERGVSFDPEGLLSTLPATANVLAGYLTTRFMIRQREGISTVALLLIAGNLLVLVALFWNYVLPFNKKLWTSSFVVFATGIDVITTAVLFYSLEVRSWKKGVYFFLVFGRNPLFLYVLSNLFLVFFILPVQDTNFHEWINRVFFQQVAPGAVGSLLFALVFTAICWLVGWIMDKRKIYVRL